jgi:hypothetical protein
MSHKSKILAVAVGSALVVCETTVMGGMPAPLPTNWTKGHTPEWVSHGESWNSSSIDARVQAISFFLVFLLICACGVKWLWAVLRREMTWLPVLDYRRAVSLTILWGLLFIVVLTMISGARELMTPGAWRKQGWTYKLADATSTASVANDSRSQRRKTLEQLRIGLLTYAATHQGQFPLQNDPAIDASLWDMAGWPGVQFQMVSDREAGSAPQLLVFEPEVDGEERQVILTNGMIGTMRSAEIRQAVMERIEP